MSAWAIVLAAGSGSRFGAAKQFLDVRGRRAVDRSIEGARAVCEHVVVVLPPDVAWDGPAVDAVVVGGATRAASVRAGIACVPPDAEVVFVHDAARPLASAALWNVVAAALTDGVDAVVPGLPVTDTLKRVDDDKVVGTVEREGLIAVQTPQAFRAVALRAAHASGFDATDDAAHIEAQGGTVRWVNGEPTNLKLTHPEDHALLDAILAGQEGTA